MALTDNHFELFKLEPNFDIDTAQIAERYRELQRVVHPDKFANASEQERRLAMQSAAQINEAYQTLKSPLKRAQYLLALQGIEDSPEAAMDMDSSFLFEQMELRETLEGIKNKADPLDTLNQFMDSLERKIKALHQQLSQQFGAQAYKDMLSSVRKLQFLNKLHEEALRLEENLI